MGEDDKNPDDKVLGAFWLVGVVITVLAFATAGHSASALFAAVAGGVGHPDSRNILHRYGIAGLRRVQIVAGAAVLAFVMYAVAPQAERDDRAAPSVDVAQDDDVEASRDEEQLLDARAAPLTEIIGCSAVDGDTLNCSGERIRLLGIDAPEMGEHCPPGRVCAPGDGDASRSHLVGLLQYSMTIERVGEDQYGRTLGLVLADGENLSCIQLSAGQATYVSEWDDGGRVANWCPAVAF